jgi:hypothetical protein
MQQGAHRHIYNFPGKGDFTFIRPPQAGKPPADLSASGGLNALTLILNDF